MNLQVVTTKRRSTSNAFSNDSNSPNSPFKDDDENNKTNHGEAYKNISGNINISGNGELPNGKIVFSNGSQNHHTTNKNSSIRYLDYQSSIGQTAQTNNSNGHEDGNEQVEPDIIPVKAQKLSKNATGSDAEMDKRIMSRESSSSPTSMFSKEFDENIRCRNEDDNHYNLSTSSSKIKILHVIFVLM